VVAAPATSTPSVASYDPSAASVDVGNSLAVQRDGTIVVAGLSRRYGEYRFALAKHRPDGRPDQRFGKGGVVLTSVGRGTIGAFAVVEAPARKILAVGGAYAGDSRSGFALARYTQRGRLDPTFGGDGTVLTTFARPRRDRFALATAHDVALQRDGRIAVVGVSTDGVDAAEAVLARYIARGPLDRSFGAGGKASYAPTSPAAASTSASAIALQRDGRLVVAGSIRVSDLEAGHFLVARFTRRGRVDRGFGTSGGTVTRLGLFSYASDVAIQPDGRIVVVGTVRPDLPGRAGTQLGVIRLLSNGRIDTSFGTNGTVLTNFAVDSAPRLVLQADGKIVAACTLRSPSRFGLARYLPDGRLDPTFGEGGRVRTRFPERSVARDVAVTRDGKILVAGSSGGDFALARYNGDGSLDESFGVAGLARTPLGPAWVER
jgi:uncharacterized delta-60 repeat protein